MPTLTVRKLIKFGHDGLVITVPRGWVRFYRLSAGDQLEVIANGELIIRPLKQVADKREAIESQPKENNHE